MLRKRNAIRQDISNAPIIGCIKKHFQQSKRKKKMDKELKISAENALAAYNNTDANGRELLEHLFGKEIFAQDIKDKVKTFEDAVAILGEEHPLVAQFRVIESSFKEADNNLHLFAYARLVIIAEALNEDWEPKFDSDTCRYYPWFNFYIKAEYEKLNEGKKKECHVIGRSYGGVVYAGTGFVGASYASSYSGASHGSRLAFKTKELAEYCGKQFIDIWEKFLFA